MTLHNIGMMVFEIMLQIAYYQLLEVVQLVDLAKLIHSLTTYGKQNLVLFLFLERNAWRQVHQVVWCDVLPSRPAAGKGGVLRGHA